MFALMQRGRTLPVKCAGVNFKHYQTQYRSADIETDIDLVKSGGHAKRSNSRQRSPLKGPIELLPRPATRSFSAADAGVAGAGACSWISPSSHPQRGNSGEAFSVSTHGNADSQRTSISLIPWQSFFFLNENVSRLHDRIPMRNLALGGRRRSWPIKWYAPQTLITTHWQARRS